MSGYLDASFLVSAFSEDRYTARALGFADSGPTVTTSLWAIAEFSSALSLQVRVGRLSIEERRQIELRFDSWAAANLDPQPVLAQDFERTRALLRMDELALRTPDALHLAICERLSTIMVTFDGRLAAAARDIGVPVANI